MPAGGEAETVGLFTTLAMGAFLALAALIVVSVICKVIVAAGLLPRRRGSRLRRTVIWLANVVGSVSVVKGRAGSSSGRSRSGGGGSSGGAGASGEF